MMIWTVVALFVGFGLGVLGMILVANAAGPKF
jgi:hypothetical protein